MPRVYIVTGAGRGIGKAVARYLLDSGDAVTLVDLGCHVDGTGADVGVSSAAAAELGGDSLAITADVREPQAMQDAVATTLARWGRVDGVLNVAAVLRPGNILTETDDDWVTTLDVNLNGTRNLSRAAILHWVEAERPGRIVNVTSTAGLEGNAEMCSYSASKAAIVGLTLATSHAVASAGILVNAIAPLAATRMAVRGLGDEALAERARTGSWPDVAARGLAPERVAPVAAYLVSEELRVTGRVFTVGGGTAGRLPVPAPEISIDFDDGMTPIELHRLVDETLGRGVERTRWQADAVNLTRAEFPVAALDA
jgi:NAD(P)-dependent dehydrogenase (short-subunit alcohol dehydrogenase family)